ncbi:MAG: hypothetical protein ACXVJ7_09875 [Acidimicrobiia bacterium]
MLGRKDFTREEIDGAAAMVSRQLASYKKVAKLATTGSDAKAAATLTAFETAYGNALALALDRVFVHRVRAVTGKDTTPLNELELIAESLMLHDGVFTTNTVIKYVPDRSVLGLKAGDPVALSAEDFERLAAACFEELQAKFR